MRMQSGTRAVMAACVVIALVGAVLGWSAWPMVRPAPVVRVEPIVLAPREVPTDEDTGPTGPTVQAPGWVEPEPDVVACTALADGVVSEVLVLEGDRVESGQVVARLIDEDARLSLGRAEAGEALARAALASAEAEAEAARRDLEELVDRERAVASARSQLEEAKAELARLPSQIEAATATWEALREEARRAQQSFDAGAANDIEVIVMRKRAEAAEATLESLRRHGPVLEARVSHRASELRAAERHASLRIEEIRDAARTEASVERARAALEEALVGVEEAALRLSRMTIRAPIDGVVQRRLKTVGDKVMLGMDDAHSAHLFHVYDPDRLQVRVDVALEDASHIRVGQVCEVVVEVLPDEVFRGEVLRVTHEADLQKNTLEVKVGILDPSPALRPEMLARVTFVGSDVGRAGPSGELETAVLMPSEAVRDGGVVWVVRDRRSDRGVLRRASVTSVVAEGAWVRARGTVHPGDLVVVGDGDVLREGRVVRMEGSS